MAIIHTHEPAPAGALDASSLGVDLLDELVKRAKVLLDLLGKVARGGSLGLLRASGRKVLPEELRSVGIQLTSSSSSHAPSGCCCQFLHTSITHM